MKKKSLFLSNHGIISRGFKYEYMRFGFVALFLINLFATSAQTGVYKTEYNYDFIEAEMLIDINIPPLASVPNRIIKSVKIYRELVSGDDFELGNYGFHVFFNSSITVNQNTIPTLYEDDVEFSIDETKPQETHFIDLSNVSGISAITTIRSTLSDVDIQGTVEAVAYLNSKLKFKVICEIEYGTDVRPESILLNPLTVVEDSKQQNFTWAVESGRSCPNYQLQLLRLFNKDNSLVSSPDHIKADIDWSKALTIETQSSSTSGNLTIAEGSGYYMWRIRPIGTYYEGGANNDKNYGPWSHSSANSEIELQPGFTNEDCFYYIDMDEDINWIYSRTFTEGNAHIAENVTYATPLQNIRQSQKYLPSANTKLISQIVPDNSGRPVVTSIPVPVQNPLEGYRERFMLNSSNELFTAENFDLDANINNPDPVAMVGEFIYYNGSTGYVPSAEGYPYQRTLYLNDGSSRVREQSGVGKMHSIGSTPDRGKTVKTYYGQPSEDELVRVFGDEAPDVSKVSKVITMDQNEVISISYTTIDGKILATCLLYDANNPLDGETSSSYTTHHVVKGNSKKDESLMSTSRLVLEEEKSNISIHYRLPIPDMEVPCGSVYLDCNYTLYVRIYDINNQSLVYDNNGQELPMTAGQTILEAIVDNNMTGGVLSLPKGEYLIEKELVPGGKEDVLLRMDQALSIDPIIDFVVEEMEKVTGPTLKETFYQTMLDFSSAFNECASTGDCNVLNTNYPDYPEIGNLMLTGEYSFNLQILEGETYTDIIDYSTIEALPHGQLVYIFITSSCCQDIRIPIIFESMFACPEDGDMANYDPQFEQYLQAIVPPEQITNLMGGYASGEFNTMVFKMLNYTFVDGNNNNEITPFYTCDQLWTCWLSTIKANTGFADASYSNINISDEVDNRDDPDDGDGNQHDNLFNDKSNFRGFKGWFIRKMIKIMSLSERVRNKTNGSNTIDYQVNLPELFLECAGYNFARVLATQDDFNSMSDPDYDPERHFYNGPVENGQIDPHIKDRVYAFKYFEYDYDNTSYGGKNNACEMMTCFEVDLQDYCMDIEPCTHGRETWHEAERKEFLDCLRNVDAHPEPEDVKTCLEIFVDGVLMGPSPNGWYNIEKEMKDVCNSNCDSKREHYKQMIIYNFEKRCYTIDGCITDPTSVSMDVVDQLADKMVEECKTFCVMQGEIECKEIPKCIDLYTEAEKDGFPTISFTESCDEISLQVSEWFLEFDVTSQCGTPVTDHLCTDPPPLNGTIEDFCNGLGGEMRKIQHTQVNQLEVKDVGGTVTINP